MYNGIRTYGQIPNEKRFLSFICRTLILPLACTGAMTDGDIVDHRFFVGSVQIMQENPRSSAIMEEIHIPESKTWTYNMRMSRTVSKFSSHFGQLCILIHNTLLLITVVTLLNTAPSPARSYNTSRRRCSCSAKLISLLYHTVKHFGLA